MEASLMPDALSIPVQLKITSTITQQGEKPEQIEFWSEGTLMEKRGQIYLQYTEVQEDSHIRTTLRFDDKDAMIIRNGDVKMRMPFVVGESQRGHYQSQFGQLPLFTQVKEMKYHPSETTHSGRFYLQYELIIGSEHAGNFILELQYTEGNK